MAGVDQGHLRAAVEAGQLSNAGRNAEALALIQKAQRRGSSPVLDNAGAIIQTRLGQLDAALFLAERAAAGAPGSSDIAVTLGNVLMLRGELDRAGEALTRALTLRPDNHAARTALATVDRLRHGATRAARTLGESGDKPADPAAAIAMIAALAQLGRIEQAWAYGEAAREFFPNDYGLAAAHASTSNHVPGLTREASEAAHLRVGLLWDRHRPRAARVGIVNPDPERELRVGMLSPDFRAHSVAYFVEPLLRELRGVHVTLYALHHRDDKVSRRLASLASAWRPVAWQEDAAIADLVRRDNIDVLIDLAGHTQENRLGVFQIGAAPVQMTYLGYPNISGLGSMDFRIADEVTDPEGVDAGRAGERIVRVRPPFVCYRPESTAPEPARSGAQPSVTFGSFNNTRKLNAEVIRVWARVLNEVPASRLLLKAQALEEAELRQELLERFAAHGVDAARVELRGGEASVVEHLRQYERVDVGLDPFPYNGTTTTCEALWQGVPVVTLLGQTHAGRVGATLLGALGLDELIAEDEDAYVRIAATLARDENKLNAWRSGLRATMAASRLCDATGFAAEFAAMLRRVWRERCAAASAGRTGPAGT